MTGLLLVILKAEIYQTPKLEVKIVVVDALAHLAVHISHGLLGMVVPVG